MRLLGGRTINTKVKTSIAYAMEKSGLEARYDNNARELIAQKIILAHILVATMEEYKGMDPRDVMLLIEGSPQVLHEGKNRNNKEKIRNSKWSRSSARIAPKITGMSTVLAEPGHGRIEQDIRFYVWTPDRSELNEKSIKILSNVEIQNKFNPGYNIANRQIFTTCRMISNQKDREFTGSSYDDLKKVASIWIFTNPDKAGRLSISLYKFCQVNICGNNPDQSKLYDMINIINIGLGKDTKEDILNAPGVIKLLGTLFSKTMPVEERKEILERDFGIPMQEEIEGRLSEMCNLSQDIKFEALKEGRQLGRKEGRKEGEAIGEKRGRKEGEILGEIRGRQEERISLIRVLLLRGDSEESIIDLGFTKDDIKRAKNIDED